MLFVLDYWQWHGHCPSIREVAAATGRNVSTVKTHLVKLQRKGLVDWVPGQTRTLHPMAFRVPFG